jgi:hypothetical protein
MYEQSPEQGFDNFLEGCVEAIGFREQSKIGYFRHAGVVVEDRPWATVSRAE